MDAGRLNRLISITKTTSTARSDDGAPIITISTLTSNVWAEVRPIIGRERYVNNSIYYESDVEFIMRYSTIVTELCRVTFESEYYDIQRLINYKNENIELHILGKRVR